MKAMNDIIKYLLALLSLTATCEGQNREREIIEGRVVKVSDGDTYELMTSNKTTIRVRMDGIDAPESGMPYSKKATEYLRELTKGQTIRVEKTGNDQYGRTLGFSYLPDGRELGREMIKAGYAWHYKQYNKDKELAALEKEARDAKRGLWKDKSPVAPWDVRKMRRGGNSTKELFRESTDEDLKR